MVHFLVSGSKAIMPTHLWVFAQVFLYAWKTYNNFFLLLGKLIPILQDSRERSLTSYLEYWLGSYPLPPMASSPYLCLEFITLYCVYLASRDTYGLAFNIDNSKYFNGWVDEPVRTFITAFLMAGCVPPVVPFQSQDPPHAERRLIFSSPLWKRELGELPFLSTQSHPWLQSC